MTVLLSRWIGLGVISFCLLFSSCAVKSDKPLSPAREAFRDRRLEGLWCADEGQNRFYFYIAYRPDGTGSIFWFGSDETGPGELALSFFVTRTAKHAYLNLQASAEFSKGRMRLIKDNTYNFLEYRFSWNGRLAISLIGGEAFSRAIKSGALRGKVDGFTPTILHERSGHLLNFIEAAAAKDVILSSWSARKIGNR